MGWSASFTNDLCWRLKALGAPKVQCPEMCKSFHYQPMSLFGFLQHVCYQNSTHTHTDFHIYKCTIGINYADDPVGAGLCGALDTMDRSPQSELGGPIMFSFFIVVLIYDACF